MARASPAQVTSVKLSETAMLIYVYIQSRSGDSVRLRDIQRAMNFSSPSSALFHLQKLESVGLVQKDNVGDYRIKTRVRVSLVRNFLIIKGTLIPRKFLTRLTRRSEEHTSELQSPYDLVCRLLLEKKKTKKNNKLRKKRDN